MLSVIMKYIVLVIVVMLSVVGLYSFEYLWFFEKIFDAKIKFEIKIVTRKI